MKERIQTAWLAYYRDEVNSRTVDYAPAQLGEIKRAFVAGMVAGGELITAEALAVDAPVARAAGAA